MVNFRKLSQKAKEQVDKRGGTDALKGDLDELKDIAKGKGSIKDKAKAAGEAIKEPGKRDKEPGAQGTGGDAGTEGTRSTQP